MGFISVANKMRHLLPGKHNRSIMFFTTHRAASMLIFQIAEELSCLGGFSFYSIHKRNFDEGDPQCWKDRNSCYAPLRGLPRSIRPHLLSSYNIVLHLRDPRDMLVSLFFSQAFSHSIVPGIFEPTPEERQRWIEEGIDASIFKTEGSDGSWADIFLEIYERYRTCLLGRPNVTFVTYEEMVGDFKGWLHKIIVPFNIPHSDRVVMNMYDKYERTFHVEQENVWAHRRKVTPGDYREKLRPETIEKLNQKFKTVLNTFGYSF